MKISVNSDHYAYSVAAISFSSRRYSKGWNGEYVFVICRMNKKVIIRSTDEMYIYSI